MMKKVIVVVGLLICHFTPALAADFTAHLESEYTFLPAAPAKVNHDFTLTNTNAAVFVQNYQVSLPGSAANIVVQQKKQTINKQQHDDHERQVLELTFENEVVGQGKKREFAIEYTDNSLSSKRGGATLIRIPALAGAQDIDTVKTIVRLPLSFGAPDFVSPKPVKTGTGSGQLVYTFDQSGGETIDIGFGQEQVLQFELSHTISNQTNYPAYQTVTFPGDRDDVQFIYSSLTPEPDSWEAQADGTWQGHYLLDIGETRQVEASGYLIYAHLDRDFRIQDVYPHLDADFYTWDLTDIPADLHLATPSASISGSVGHYGWWPFLDQYEVSIRNHTGYMFPGWRVSLIDRSDRVQINPETHELTLYPWQKSVIISKVHGQWWQLYLPYALTIRLEDAQGNIIDEQKVTGLTLSYLALAGLGGIIAAATLAGCLLVDGRE